MLLFVLVVAGGLWCVVIFSYVQRFVLVVALVLGRFWLSVVC